MQTIVILGNFIDGLQFVGPFESWDEAVKWADDIRDIEWHVVRLDDPSSK
jgi:hypothetical protein